MPYVQRNGDSEITGLFACKQPDMTEEDFLPETDPEVTEAQIRLTAHQQI